MSQQPALDTMQDFGEYLVEVRDRLDVPLPPRVRWWRVFWGVFVESFCLSCLRLIRRDYRSISLARQGLSKPQVDLNFVMNELKVLSNVPATFEQIEQARRTIDEQVQRRCARLNYELDAWIGAMRAGTFLGAMLSLLIPVSMLMSMVTHHIEWVARLSVGYALAEIIAVMICLNDWHRP